MSDKLTLKEKYLLHIIIDYNNRSKVFFYKNKKIADVLELTTSSVSNIISKLSRNGYITVTKSSDGKRVLTYTRKPFDHLLLFPIQKNVDLRIENNKLAEQLKEVDKLKAEVEYYKSENKALTVQLENLWKRIPEKQ